MKLRTALFYVIFFPLNFELDIALLKICSTNTYIGTKCGLILLLFCDEISSSFKWEVKKHHKSCGFITMKWPKSRKAYLHICKFKVNPWVVILKEGASKASFTDCWNQIWKLPHTNQYVGISSHFCKTTSNSEK